MAKQVKQKEYKILSKLQRERCSFDLIKSVQQALNTVTDISESDLDISLSDAIFEVCDSCVPVHDDKIRANVYHLDQHAARVISEGLIPLEEHSFTLVCLMRCAWHLFLNDCLDAEIYAIAFNIMADAINGNAEFSKQFLESATADNIDALSHEISEHARYVTEDSTYREILESAHKAMAVFLGEKES